MALVTVLCPSCAEGGAVQPIRADEHAQQVRCEQCRRHFGLRVMVTARPARQMPLDASLSRYQIEGEGGALLRIVAPPGMSLPQGAQVACVYAGERLAGIAHQQSDRWYPIPDLDIPERRRRAAGATLAAALVLAGVLAVLWGQWLIDWAESASAWAVALAVVTLLILLVPAVISERPRQEIDPMLMRSADRWGGE